jgi:hypothetical protein
MAFRDQLREPVTLVQWENALVLISLDRAAPLWPEMGLPAQNHEAVNRCIRNYLRAMQKLQDIEEDVDYVGPALDEFDHMAECAARADLDGGINALTNWFLNVYLGHRREWDRLYFWSRALGELGTTNADELSAHGFPAEEARSFAILAERWAEVRIGIETRLERVQRLPFSSWDAEQYRRYRLEQPELDPLTNLPSILESLAFVRHWRDPFRRLTPQQRTALAHWGKERAAAMGDDPASAVIPSYL